MAFIFRKPDFVYEVAPWRYLDPALGVLVISPETSRLIDHFMFATVFGKLLEVQDYERMVLKT